MKRLRMFAGPNGSGKSTVYEKLNHQYDFGVYVNADEIEKRIRSKGYYDLSGYGVHQHELTHFDEFSENHSLKKKAESQGYKVDLVLTGSRIVNPKNATNSYEAAIITDFLRHSLIKKGDDLTFETVMAHISKIETLKKSHGLGYRNYVYYVGTSDPSINQSRVLERVRKGGHPVNPKKIESRYFESLALLIRAIPYSYRTFIIDNSGYDSELVLEVYQGKKVIFNTPGIPKWVNTYLLDKIV